MPVLFAENLEFRFGGVQAVAGVSITLDAGEVVALIGPNGAGKSTCFALLAGELYPDRGRVLLAGRDITRRAPAARCRYGVGRTFQISATFSSMTVRENVQISLASHNRRSWRFGKSLRATYAAEADSWLSLVGLLNQADNAASGLAYGDLKRLELAMTLAGSPRVLLMDEPTAGMSPAERGSMMQVVRELAAQKNLAVLFTEHDMEVVFSTATRVIALFQGRIIAEGTSATVASHPQVRNLYFGRLGHQA